MPRARRGRPPKFDRPSRLVALTLPLDALVALRRVHPDLAKAIVALAMNGAGRRKPGGDAPPPEIELVSFTPREALILINPAAVGPLPGVSVLPIDERRAFLALEPERGLTDLEIAVQDRLDEAEVGDSERSTLVALKNQLRAWRRDPKWRFESRAIIVGTRPPRRPSRPRRRS